MVKKCMFGGRKGRCKRPQKSIRVVGGTAHYVKTEVEDSQGRWNDDYYTRDGYWVLHEGNKHYIYKM
jgi:hypothetical protein